jgi:hypothetical protein
MLSATTCLAQAVLGGCFFMGKFKIRKKTKLFSGFLLPFWQIFLNFLADF